MTMKTKMTIVMRLYDRIIFFFGTFSHCSFISERVIWFWMRTRVLPTDPSEVARLTLPSEVVRHYGLPSEVARAYHPRWYGLPSEVARLTIRGGTAYYLRWHGLPSEMAAWSSWVAHALTFTFIIAHFHSHFQSIHHKSEFIQNKL